MIFYRNISEYMHYMSVKKLTLPFKFQDKKIKFKIVIFTSCAKPDRRISYDKQLEKKPPNNILFVFLTENNKLGKYT